MFRRKLSALNHIEAATFSLDNEADFRNLVVWLEDQKIRFYKIEERSQLRKINDKQWSETYKKYLNDLDCPITSGITEEELEWLLSFSVSLMFNDKKLNTTTPKTKLENPLDGLDFHSNEFKEGVNMLARLFEITPQADHLLTLKAVSKIVTHRLSAKAIEKPDSIVSKGDQFPLENVESGFEFGDPILNQAAKILRLLFIHDLRQLQTSINECIVSVQNITANPKTDTKLGKVGR